MLEKKIRGAKWLTLIYHVNTVCITLLKQKVALENFATDIPLNSMEDALSGELQKAGTILQA